MHARINYVDIKPEAFEEVDQFWRDVVSGYDGLVAGYFLRDGDSAHTLSVVVFADEETMHANTEQQLSVIVKQVASHRLSEPQLHPLEVCAHVAGNTGKVGYARVLEVELKPEKMQSVIDDWAPQVAHYAEVAGFRGGYMCSDRKTGKTRSVTLWETEADVRANESSGAMDRAVGPYQDAIAVAPKKTYWAVRVAL